MLTGCAIILAIASIYIITKVNYIEKVALDTSNDVKEIHSEIESAYQKNNITVE